MAAPVELCPPEVDPGGPPIARLPPGALERLAERAEGGAGSISVRMPFTGQFLGEVPRGTPEDVARAARRARAAQRRWARVPVRERARVLLRFHDLVLDRREEALDLIQLEAGKARRDAHEEVLDCANVARHYAFHGPRLLRPRRRKGAVPLLTRVTELRQPHGLVVVVVPWNYPLNLGITDAIPALLAGNAVLLKPDHQTSFTALWGASLLRDAGVPADLVPVVTGEGPELGSALLDAADYMMFTGSTETGRAIAAGAGKRLIGVSLELGGKNPMLVLDDADVDRAVRGAVRGSFVGAGQVCVSTERIYVHHRLHDRFLERFVARAGALRLGCGLDFTAEMGSLGSPAQLERVTTHVEDAVAKGARLWTGGRPRPDVGPLFYEPTILTGVTPEMELHAEETFGPVVSVYRVGSEDEAVQRANETRYGLNASVWTRDLRRGGRVAARIRAGTVCVNEPYVAGWGSADAPMGGMGDSGHSRRHGAEGILKYTEPRTIAVQRGPMIAPPEGVPQEAFARGMVLWLRLLHHLPGVR